VPGEVFTPDMTLFKQQRLSQAIGGLQIVRGDTARQHGYCPDSRYCKPLKKLGDGFRDTHEDKVYRGIVSAGWEDLPGAFRLRHSRSAFESQESRLAQTGGEE
jgi:hypothetical protein